MPMTQLAARYRPVAVQLVLAAVRLAAIGLIAVGISGVLAWAMGSIAGRTFVAGDPPGVAYTAARCRDFLEYVPHAHTCAQAATVHHFGEIVWYRTAAGILGGLVLAALTWVQRHRTPQELEPETLIPTVAAAVFCIAGIMLMGRGIDIVILNADGAGSDLSGGIVALAFALWFAVPVLRALTVREATIA